MFWFCLQEGRTSKAHLSAISQLTQSQGMVTSSPVVLTRPCYFSLYQQHTFLLAALSVSVHKNQSTAKQRPQDSTDIPFTLPIKHILYFSILQEPCWETDYRSKRWLCLPAFPGKTLQLGQLRPSLITAYSISARGLAVPLQNTLPWLLPAPEQPAPQASLPGMLRTLPQLSIDRGSLRQISHVVEMIRWEIQV